MSFLIRVQLPDRPGALGAVATALGEVGVDILSLDVVERRSGIAIDDLVVELPAGRLPDVLITAAESVEGVEVEAPIGTRSVTIAHWRAQVGRVPLFLLDPHRAANPAHLRATTDRAH